MASQWYERPYPGGKMIDLPGFPRPLHPPDAAPDYYPSIDGPDVVAYKRTVSRLGRWPWQPFDDAYSDAFSHGKPGGNVSDSGVAGCQRQQGWSASGYVGEKTFNFLRSARIPEGLPHAGEYGMDATAQALLVDAWHEFHGAPDRPSAGTSAAARLAKAKSYLGVKESPAGSNKTDFGAWYGMNGQPWCAIFVTYCDQLGGNPTPSFSRGTRYAYVPYILNDARNGANGLTGTNNPEPGDLVIYDWEDNSEPDHIGVFESWIDASRFNAIEGNTSIDNNSDGGQVMRRTRTRNYQVSFVRVAE